MALKPGFDKEKITKEELKLTGSDSGKLAFVLYNVLTKEHFYKDPAISRVLPHRRYATKLGPGYVMLVTLDAAFRAYLKLFDRTVSFSKFASLRPRNVRKLGSVPADTCLCVTCTNVKLKVDVINKALGPAGNIVAEANMFKFLLCPYRGRWPQQDCISGQVLMLQDFAENRKATYDSEVKSAHFGKAQVSLHPTVCFYKDGYGQLVRHVMMCFSDDITHDYHAVHCYTDKAVSLIREETSLKELILWSDGAASQYKECDELIKEAENVGFVPAMINAGPNREVSLKEVRNSGRCYIDSLEYAGMIWDRIKDYVPAVWGHRSVVGLNERLRVLRYDPGEYFKPHYDGSYVRENGEKSYVTFQLYLNEGFKGGATTFLGNKDKSIPVVPKTGSVLIFQHNILHEGSLLVKGRKYSARTDVMYACT